ncbi:protein BLISTER [Sesamum alatum]|uniref:Protein BLISTER n=1 Tax=Sesamum alatum TaxID=300844 RepID=A0AAE1Y8B7_9LAMI|nr:protein BLISTER [Sesamum alatum]
MASAQVLRKQEHLEAGKRKLEEFRRKKAAERAKKTTSTSQVQASDGVIHQKQPSETEHVRHTDANGVGTSDALAEGRWEPSGVVPKVATKEYDISIKSDISSSADKNVTSSPPSRHNDINSSVLGHSHSNSEDYKDAASVGSDGFRTAKDILQIRKDDHGSSSQVPSRVGNDHFLNLQAPSSQENNASSHSTYHDLDNYPSNNIDGPEKDLSRGNLGTSAGSTDVLPKRSVSALLLDKLGNSGHEDKSLMSSPYQESLRSTSNVTNSAFGHKQTFSAFSDLGEKKLSGADDRMGSVNQSSPWTSDNKYADYDNDARSSSNHAPSSPPAAGRRNRPSFLDSIQITKGPMSSPPLFVAEKADTSKSKVFPMDGLESSVSQRSANSSVASGDGVGQFNHVRENKYEFFPSKQNDDFAALEQHIEDLTQEKFSLQRALEASRALAESLASENSALTESFNQQGSVVNQLKFDLERLQEEIKAQLVELEAVKREYAIAQLECNAADERAKLLASEVIELEEKALRLRSNELKLERQLENTQAEISSYRKKMASLEKDRQDLLSTIDALQEEKKLLQSKLRKASSSGNSIDLSKTSRAKQDVSTSTEDLESGNSENLGSALPGDDAPSSQVSHENIHLSLEGLPTAFPSDQIRIIENINTLIAELALEKDQLTRALSAESSQSSQLLELNKELTRKLEAQTQRLELLTAQSMANDNSQPRQLDPPVVHENTTYADEGDEVVERVLGWIMKLFPGGPSRRRPSKHL